MHATVSLDERDSRSLTRLETDYFHLPESCKII